MKYLLASVVLILSMSQLKAQSDTTELVVDVQASYPGGPKAWNKFLKKNLKYPKVARRANVEGHVFLSFIVNKDGSVSDVETLKNPDSNLAKEAVRVMKKSINWTPGKYKGHNVKSSMTIRITFKLR